MIKVILIDIDNTLLSFTEYVKHAMKDGFARFGIADYKEEMFGVAQTINNGLWQEIERGELTFEELMKIRWNRIFEALGLSFDGLVFESYFRDYLYESAIVEPGAKEMLAYLKGKYTLCAASNGPYDQQINRLRLAGMYEAFDFFFISENIGFQKPSTGFFDHCFKVLRENGFPGLQPSETMIIGDSLTSDMAGGMAYGVKTCLFLREDIPDEKLAGIDHVVTDLRSVKDFL